MCLKIPSAPGNSAFTVQRFSFSQGQNTGNQDVSLEIALNSLMNEISLGLGLHKARRPITLAIYFIFSNNNLNYFPCPELNILFERISILIHLKRCIKNLIAQSS